MSIYDFSAKSGDGKEIKFSNFSGKVLLIVNSATGCGFTPQYEGLELLYQKYHEKGLEILDFPCDQFGHQAPGTDEEIHNFCVSKYSTSYVQFSKIDVNGDDAHPLFKFLKNKIDKSEIRGMKNKLIMSSIKAISSTCTEKGDIVWNFTKFLVDRNGAVVKRYDPTFLPSDIDEEIVRLLG